MAQDALYCTPVDVFRHFNPGLNENTLSANDFIGSGDDRELIMGAIEDASGEFDDLTRRAHRTTRVGSPGAPATYEFQGADMQANRWPVVVELDHDNIHPFDSSKGDSLEIRTGKDSWTDITDEAGNQFVLDHRRGRLTLYRRLRRMFWFESPDRRYIRTSYRYGGLGGSRNQGGQTTLTSDIDDTATTLDVDDAGRLSSSGVLALGNREYARISSLDYDANTVTVSRGKRGTAAVSHTSGDVVHYCPLSVRNGVAARAAQELVRYDDWTDQLVESGQGIDPQSKIDDWQTTWEATLAKHSGVRSL